MTAELKNPIKLRVSPNSANAIVPISLAVQAFPVAVERTAERLPIPCLTTVCRTPHAPLCVAQHRCCARLEARGTWLATQNDRRRESLETANALHGVAASIPVVLLPGQRGAPNNKNVSSVFDHDPTRTDTLAAIACDRTLTHRRTRNSEDSESSDDAQRIEKRRTTRRSPKGHAEQGDCRKSRSAKCGFRRPRRDAVRVSALSYAGRKRFHRSPNLGRQDRCPARPCKGRHRPSTKPPRQRRCEFGPGRVRYRYCGSKGTSGH
jgi:hypothetical protein